MALLLLVVTSMTTFFSSIQRTTSKQELRTRATDGARIALDRMVKDVRQAESFYPGSGASVLDMDTYVDGVAKRVTYTASGTTLTRSVGSASAPILGDLASTALFTFTPSVTTPTLVTLTVSVHPYPDDAETVTVTSEVHLRNR